MSDLPPPPRPRSLNVLVDADLRERLDILCARTGMKKAAFVNRALADYLDRAESAGIRLKGHNRPVEVGA